MTDPTNADDSKTVHVNEWIPYTKAKHILQSEFNATEEEIIMWIETGEITPKNAWIEIDVGHQKKMVLRQGLFTCEPSDLRNKLHSLDFSEDEVNHFVPKTRWLSFNQIVERWAEHKQNIDDVVAILAREIGVRPVAEEIELGKNLNQYLYPLSSIEDIEKKHFLPLPQAVVVGNDLTDSRSDKKPAGKDKESDIYTQREKNFNQWREQSGININALKVERIFNQVKQNNRALWNIGIASFRRDFWQRYSKEYDLKKKPGRLRK